MFKRNLQTISYVLLAVSVLCLVATVVISVISHNYRNYEGTYVSKICNRSLFTWENDYNEMVYERKDIVSITRQDDGYLVDYIVSVDNDDGGTVFDYYDGYFEYRGIMAEKAARKGGTVECVEQMTGRSFDLRFIFAGNYLCVINGDDVHICEKTGYDVYSILSLVGKTCGIIASICGAAFLLVAGIRGRRRVLVISTAVSATVAVVAFVLIPRQCVDGIYVQRELPDNVQFNTWYFNNGEYHFLSSRANEIFYGKMIISYAGDGKYTVVTVQDGTQAEKMSLEFDWKGRLVPAAGEDSQESSTLIKIKNDCIGLNQISYNEMESVEYVRMGMVGLDMSLRYIVLLPFVSAFVVLLIVSGRRRAYLKAHPVVPYGKYAVADIVYIDGNMEYMRDYMFKNHKGMPVELGRDAFAVGDENKEIPEYVPVYGDTGKEMAQTVNMKRCVCITLGGDAGNGRGSSRYYIVYNKSRSALVYSVDGHTIAAFWLVKAGA